MYLEPKGRDWGLMVNWDDLGKLYAIFIVVWTLLLLGGCVLLVIIRRLPFIRIRNMPLAILSTAFLHIYLIKICLAYTTNGHFPCSAEYWIMSIYLPFGVALHQGYLVQLQNCWEQQQRLVSSSSTSKRCFRWQSLSSSHKSYCIIGSAMLVQIVVTAALYITSPTLQGDWTSFGKVSHAKGQALCRKSPVWIPSAFWQLFWSWIYGPYVLAQTRHIADTHFWRVQVTISVIAGLLGSPMWLIALYSPRFILLNRRWVPPMWLAPGIIVIQFVTIFFPLFEAWKSQPDRQDTLLLDVPSTTRIDTMAALRKALSINPTPLLEFAATKDFSAENILFLIQVRQWKSIWSTKPREHLFRMGVDIYRTLINHKTAEYPINIDSKTRMSLDRLFSAALQDNSEKSPLGQSIVSQIDDFDTDTALRKKQSMVTTSELFFSSHPCVRPLDVPDCVIEDTFDEHIFDEAEKSIEYLVLTNTWQRFVRNRRDSRKQHENSQIV